MSEDSEIVIQQFLPGILDAPSPNHPAVVALNRALLAEEPVDVVIAGIPMRAWVRRHAMAIRSEDRLDRFTVVLEDACDLPAPLAPADAEAIARRAMFAALERKIDDDASRCEFCGDIKTRNPSYRLCGLCNEHCRPAARDDAPGAKA